MPEPLRRYRFHPLERRGLVVGLAGPQVAVLGAGVLVALGLAGAARSAGGVVAAMGVLVLAAAAACWPLAGRPPIGWLPVLGSWAARRNVRVAPAGASAPPPGVRLLEAPQAPGDEPLGVVHDRRSGTWAAVLPVASRAFTLLDPEDKRRRLAAWGAVLASTARTGSPVHRIQWVERTAPIDHSGLADPPPGLAPAATSGRAAPVDCAASYRDLLAGRPAGGHAHEVLLVVAVHPRRGARQRRGFGHGRDAACALLRRELRLLRGQLRNAEVEPRWPLDLAGLAGAVRAAVEPVAGRRPRHAEAGAWPLAWRDGWSAVRVDGRWHATYWVAEWPRSDVGPDFLAPLLYSAAARTLSVTMAPVPAQRAAREAESARTAELADDELRRRAGFLQTARHRRQAEGVATREAELADGHAELRFSGYVSVAGASPAELDAGCAAVEAAAHQAGLEVRRLHGQQAEAFTWTLPLGRGLS